MQKKMIPRGITFFSVITSMPRNFFDGAGAGTTSPSAACARATPARRRGDSFWDRTSLWGRETRRARSRRRGEALALTDAERDGLATRDALEEDAEAEEGWREARAEARPRTVERVATASIATSGSGDQAIRPRGQG